jgi:hypothetical protein
VEEHRDLCIGQASRQRVDFLSAVAGRYRDRLQPPGSGRRLRTHHGDRCPRFTSAAPARPGNTTIAGIFPRMAGQSSPEAVLVLRGRASQRTRERLQQTPMPSFGRFSGSCSRHTSTVSCAGGSGSSETLCRRGRSAKSGAGSIVAITNARRTAASTVAKSLASERYPLPRPRILSPPRPRAANP